jgi:hypothetical protein
VSDKRDQCAGYSAGAVPCKQKPRFDVVIWDKVVRSSCGRHLSWVIARALAGERREVTVRRRETARD